jgi:hypothetical protein
MLSKSATLPPQPHLHVLPASKTPFASSVIDPHPLLLVLLRHSLPNLPSHTVVASPSHRLAFHFLDPHVKRTGEVAG